MAVLGKETFVDFVPVFANRSIHVYCAHGIKMRQQVMLMQDMQLQQGWTTATDRKIRQWLVKLDRIRRDMIHTAGNQDQKIENLEDLAKNLSLELPEASNTTGIGDAVARPSGRPFEFRYALDGSNKNVPMISQMLIRNIDGYTLISALDLHITTASRLDSREATHRITPEEGAILFSGLLEMWTICDQFGGDPRVVGITEGVLPTEEPQGPARSDVFATGATETRPTT